MLTVTADKLTLDFCTTKQGQYYPHGTVMRNKLECITHGSVSRWKALPSFSDPMCLSGQRGLPYFLWCCFCRAASDNCPWRINLLCLSISPSIRAKAWEPMKERSAPKPSSSSSWSSVTKTPELRTKLDCKCSIDCECPTGMTMS